MKITPTLCLAGLALFSASAAHAQSDIEHQRQIVGQFESWVALGIITASILTAWLMNYSAPKVRVIGTLLAASGCFAIAAWFLFFVVGTGFLENPKPNQTMLDSAKPALLWMQALGALGAGIALLAVAFHQSKSNETLDLQATNEPTRYGRTARMLHWTIAILFIALIPMGIFTSMIPEETPYRNAYYVVHKTIGVLVFALILVRFVWNKISTRPALDPTLKSWERKLAHRVHIALYVMMLAVPITGYVMTSFHGFPTYFFALQLEPLWGKSDAYIIWGTFHKYILPYLLYLVLGAHILGALKHRFIDRHGDAFKRMVS